eukprot:COSAG03_NODE_10507_length_646_cov_1.027422_1_plen_215_part_11
MIDDATDYEDSNAATGLGDLHDIRVGNVVHEAYNADMPELSFTGLIHSISIWPSAIPVEQALPTPVAITSEPAGVADADRAPNDPAPFANYDALFDGDPTTKWLGQQLPAPTRIVLDYGTDGGGVDVLVSPHAFVINAPADGVCDPAQSYNPPTAFSLARSGTGATGSWETVQSYAASVETFNFGWCCTLTSVNSGEPGCLTVTRDVTDTSVHVN